MTRSQGSARVQRWQPPPRPEWVHRINAEGEHLDLPSVIPLNAKSLIATATENTGLSDFGEDEWYQPFQVLCRSLEEEAKLTLVGRLMTRQEVLLALEARLRIEDTYKQHPEIDDEEIVSPLMIIGQGRSGTSALQNLIAEDPQRGTERAWEVQRPCPPPEAATYRTDPRIGQAEGLIGMWSRVTPELRSMHDFTGWGPAESIWAQVISFRMPWWPDPLWGYLPSFVNYFADKNLADGYRYEKRLMKLLQWRNPRKQWVLKSPLALNHLPTVREAFPDMGFIWTHRDPVRAVASVVNLTGTLYWIRSDHPHQGDDLSVLTDSSVVAGVMSQPIRWLEDGTLPRECLCNVHYRDFVRDPISTIEQIYRFFGSDMTDEARSAMRTYMEEHPRSGRPGHDYDLGTAEEIQLERAAFKEYTEYFNVPEEL